METARLLTLLQGSTSERNQGIQLLVRDQGLKNKVMAMIKSKGARQDQALDIYHDSLMGLVKAAVKRKPIEHVESYLIGIAKFKWYDTLKNMQKLRREQEEINDQLQFDESTLNAVLKGERAALLRAVLSKLSKNCKEVLLLWGSGYTMLEIATRLDYKSEGMVRKKKSNCLKSLVQFINTQPQLKESLQS